LITAIIDKWKDLPIKEEEITAVILDNCDRGLLKKM